MVADPSHQPEMIYPSSDWHRNKWNKYFETRRIWNIKNERDEQINISLFRLREAARDLLKILERPELDVLSVGATQAEEFSPGPPAEPVGEAESPPAPGIPPSGLGETVLHCEKSFAETAAGTLEV